jgi:plastocyanin
MNPTFAKAVFGIGVALAIASMASIYVTMVYTHNQRTTTQISASQQSTAGSVGTAIQPSGMTQNTSNTANKASNPNAASSITTTILIPQGAAAQQVQNYYQPNPTQIPSSQTTITWINKDSAPHTATAIDNSFDTGIINVGSSGSAMIKSGSSGSSSRIQYHCTIHPWMTGTLTR